MTVRPGYPAIALTVLTLLVICVMLLRQELGVTGSTRPWLIAASTGFVPLAGITVWHSTSWYALLIFAALLLCGLGDYLGPIDFRLGLLSLILQRISFF